MRTIWKGTNKKGIYSWKYHCFQLKNLGQHTIAMDHTTDFLMETDDTLKHSDLIHYIGMSHQRFCGEHSLLKRLVAYRYLFDTCHTAPNLIDEFVVSAPGGRYQ